MKPPTESSKLLTLSKLLLLLITLAFAGAVMTTLPQSSDSKHFEKEGLVFDYGAAWELSDQSNDAAQQLVLSERTLDAQIMIIVLRNEISNAKEEEQARAALIEPSINRLLRQYETAGIKVERTPLKVNLGDAPAEGVHLRFSVDGQPGSTDICWLVLNQRLTQLFFIRPEKTNAKASSYWDQIRATFKIEKPAKNKQ